MVNRISFLILVQFLVFFFHLYGSPIWDMHQDYETEHVILQDARIYENVETRQFLRNIIFSDSFSSDAPSQYFYPQKSNGMSVGFSTKIFDSYYYLIFANNTSHQHPGEDYVTYYTRGSYVVKKSLLTHAIMQIRILIQSHPDSYIDIVPRGDNDSQLSIVLFGNYFYKNVPVPMNMLSITMSPLAKVMTTTRYQIDWKTVFQPNAYDKWNNVKNVIEKIVPQLRFISENSDGALNKLGNPVLIKTLKPQPSGSWGFNCSGFVKWIIDGFFQHLSPTKHLISLEKLKKHNIRPIQNQRNEQFEKTREPNFGIDWIRNLAYTIKTVFPSLQPITLNSQDVKDIKFFSFYPEKGYSIKHLNSILYLLSIKYPGEFFLASISTPFGSNPSLWQHRHVLALFPYFTSKGTFIISVLDTGREKTVDHLISKYPDAFIYLIKLPILDKFSPPKLPSF